MLSILTIATKSYQYALPAQIRAIKQNLELAKISGGNMIFVTDRENQENLKYLISLYRKFLNNFNIFHIQLDVKDGNINYKENAQLVIAQLFTAGIDKARELNSDYLWSLESDVIPESNNLRCMLDMLGFDDGYYDVAFCPYVSQGKGGIMGGRGNDYSHILPNIFDDEHKINEELQNKIDSHKKELEESGKPPTKEWAEKMEYFKGEVGKCPVDGNVFTLNGKKWRPRGWLEFAYPGLGKGAIVPSDWMPMGNNLFSKKSLNYMDFVGYEGKGTQDLHLAFKRLKQHGLKFCVIPHSVSHHVVREKIQLPTETKFNYKIMMLHHESEGDYVGHLRQSEHQFFAHEPGEEFPTVMITEPEYLI